MWLDGISCELLRDPESHTVALNENTIAQTRGKSVSQVALNWLLRRDEHVIPIPGTTNKLHALENADTLSWELRHGEFAAIDQALPHQLSSDGK